MKEKKEENGKIEPQPVTYSLLWLDCVSFFSFCKHEEILIISLIVGGKSR